MQKPETPDCQAIRESGKAAPSRRRIDSNAELRLATPSLRQDYQNLLVERANPFNNVFRSSLQERRQLPNRHDRVEVTHTEHGVYGKHRLLVDYRYK